MAVSTAFTDMIVEETNAWEIMNNNDNNNNEDDDNNDECNDNDNKLY